MDPITQQVVLATAGAAAAGDATYVDDVFSTYLFDGTGAAQTITNGIDLSGEGGLVWIKRRSAADRHQLYDTERGANKLLRTPGDFAEVTSFSDLLTSFNSNGFSLGADSGGFGTNPSSSTMVSWSFRKAPGFFDVVTYTGNGTAGRTVLHNLGSVPGMIIIKRTSASENWATYHRSQGATKTCRLNGDFPFSTSSSTFNNTEPTSTEFTVGTNSEVNSNGQTYVAYLFAHDDQSFGTNEDESIIKCGSFTSDSGGAFDVNVGWEPQLVLIKSSGTGDWYLLDIMRGLARTHVRTLRPNTTGGDINYIAEGYCYPHASGFASDTNFFGASKTFVYMAIRRPHKPPTAATEVFTDANPTSSGTFTVTAGFAVDAFWWGGRSNADKWYAADRLRGSQLLQPNLANSEFSYYQKFDSNTQVTIPGVTGNYSNYAAYCFKRAPGFFDVVAYEGTGSARTLDHNLEAVPELVIIKNRENGSYGWAVYTQSGGRTKRLSLNGNDAESNTIAGQFWGTSDFTSTQISLGSFANTNHNNVGMIGYLFATLDGISKVGSYSGTGSNIDVDCGFTAGARFVLIKRTDSTGDWYVWDSTRGIVSGNDPYLLLNSNAAEVTNTDYIDPLNAGFTVTSSAPAALNTSGGTYLFLAIA